MNNLRSNSLFLLILLAFFLISIVPSRSDEPAFHSCGPDNATAGMSTNIGHLLPMLVNSTKQYGSNLGTYGENKSKIYGLAQCIGGVPNEACWSCIKNATYVIRGTNYCPTQSEAAIWYDYCHVRYTTRNFYGEVSGGGHVIVNGDKVKYYIDFNGNLTALMKRTTREALEYSAEGFGSGTQELAGKDNITIYGLLQCNKDLLEPAYRTCKHCLDVAKQYLYETCYNHVGCRVFMKGCFLRYETYSFFYNATSEGNYDHNVVAVIKD